ncbi:MAG: family 16 glycosylhydrolase [Salinivirgaceae bacterium]|jgi:beta-glucanase (GH16 family)|nr:family 16 glycosylhydrolase [Salinivirgaceae bacterium]
MKKKYSKIVLGIFITGILASCSSNSKKNESEKKEESNSIEIVLEAEDLVSDGFEVGAIEESGSKYISASKEGEIRFDLDVPVAGRYKTEIYASSDSAEMYMCIEDHIDNTDDRTYNVTGNIAYAGLAPEFKILSVDGSPLSKGLHKMRVFFNKAVNIDYIKFTLMKEHEVTPVHMTQKTDGEEWSIVWADEFDGETVDTSKWIFDVGDWGWGNFEDQYYTDNDPKNARIEDGKLVIEALKNKHNDKWTSARLTTRGKVSFKYGKIEFKAKVPIARGNWAAGWTLGDTYVDEISWPYCGEIDIMESVAFERDTVKDEGVAHASVHSRAYYFKIGNQVSATIPIPDMTNGFHTYTLEWTPDYIYMFFNGEHYFTYEKTDVENSWPFDIPQNIILNLAMGGGWGGAKGIDETITSQKMVIDYVRVYEKK